MNIPTILSGPILRRAEPSSIYIWIALSKNYFVEGNLYKIEKFPEQDSFTYHLLNTISETKTIRVGQRLFISLVKLKAPLNTTLPTSQLLGYNLFFSHGNQKDSLADFGLLSREDPDSIVYGDLLFPSFHINTTEPSNILYGSCRKLHGKGEDALSQADILLEETYLSIEERPSALFLTGDQIYADDVADPISPYLTSIGKQLMGRTEELTQIEEHLMEEPFQSSINKIRGRQFIMEHFCQFTSGNAHNHLIELGEYASMYLLSWAPNLWNMIFEEGGFLTFDEIIEKKSLYTIFPEEECFEKEREKEIAKHRERYEEHATQLMETYQSLARVRRLLANTPTYMIFDDHDITDDWNLSLEWKINVHRAPLGRHVIANSLTAYWLFQGWGNDPDCFDDSFVRQLTRYLQQFDQTLNTYNTWQNLFWSFDSWHFVAPTTPMALFLDTRTQRGFDHRPHPVKIGQIFDETQRPPQLVSKHGFQLMTECLQNSSWNEGEPLIVVSPAPVYGIGLIESVLHKYVYPFRVLGVSVESKFDFEAWKYNGEGFTELLTQIARWNPSHCLILSGDVHYASSVISNVDFHDSKKLSIYQFTSSPMNNMSFSGLSGFLAKIAIFMNASQRKKKEINRYCDDTYNIIKHDRHTHKIDDFTWKESIYYQSMNNGSIIETDNNIGLIKILPTSIQNSLLLAANSKQLVFDPIPLNNNSPKK